MIKFSDYRIVRALTKSTVHTNFRSLPDDEEEVSYDYDKLTGEISFSEENLQKLIEFDLFINYESLESGEIKNVLNELNKVLENTKFSSFNLKMQTKNNNPNLIDLSFLQKLDPNLKYLSLVNIDLSILNSENLKRFEDLKILHIINNNIKNPKMLNDLNGECFIFSNNPIKEEKYSDDLLKIISKHKGKVDGLQYFYKLTNVILSKETSLKNYLQIDSQFDFSTLEKFKVRILEESKIDIDDEIDLNDENIISKLKVLNTLKNTTLETDAINYSQLHEYLPDLTTDITINNTSELSFKDLEKFKNIQSIEVRDRTNKISKRPDTYTRDEYLSISKRIDEILEGVPKANNSLGISEIEIFTEIYKRLAMQIKYDDFALTEEGKEDKVLQTNCRNLYGGLVQGQCVCAGYADILKNILSCVGIEAHHIGGNTKDSGHAWNIVKLDGEYFNTDLTWDRDYIVSRKTPEYFLKSDKDFNHDMFEITSKLKPDCNTSINKKDIQKFMSKTKKQKDQKDFSNHTYLGKAVEQAALLGLRIANFFNVSQILDNNKDKDKDKDENQDKDKDENQDLEER